MESFIENVLQRKYLVYTSVFLERDSSAICDSETEKCKGSQIPSMILATFKNTSVFINCYFVWFTIKHYDLLCSKTRSFCRYSAYPSLTGGVGCSRGLFLLYRREFHDEKSKKVEVKIPYSAVSSKTTETVNQFIQEAWDVLNRSCWLGLLRAVSLPNMFLNPAVFQGNVLLQRLEWPDFVERQKILFKSALLLREPVKLNATAEDQLL